MSPENKSKIASENAPASTSENTSKFASKKVPASASENASRFDARKSLSAKTVRSTLLSCLIFGLIIQFVALSFYAYSFIHQYIRIADAAARQCRVSVTHGADACKLSDDVMRIYNSLSDADRAKVGTPEYRQFFAEVETGNNSDYARIFRIIQDTRNFQDVSDVFIAMYDANNNAIIFVADASDDPTDVRLPGDWEKVRRNEINRFVFGNDYETLYTYDWTKQDGFLVTVGVPISAEDGHTVSYLLVDISTRNIAWGMATFALQLTIVIVLVTVLLAYFQTKLIQKKLVDPINKIAEASQQYARDRQAGNDVKDHFSNIDVHTKDELENLAEAMKEMELDLTKYEANLTQIIAEKERIGMELSLATAIQAAMLPHDFPPFPDRKEFDIYAMMEPAREVGGDFYDFFFIDEDHLCLVIADVSGKGIPAALFMMISKTILASVAMLGRRSAAEILMKTNEALCSNNKVEMFVTAWVGILEVSTGKLTAANAGHEYPFIKRADGPFEVYKDKHGLVIGGMADTVYKEYTLDLKPGDKLFVYTDGIPEASNSDGKMFGLDRLAEALNKEGGSGGSGASGAGASTASAAGSTAEIIRNVRVSVGNFVQDAEQFDDLTMLCFEYHGPQGK